MGTIRDANRGEGIQSVPRIMKGTGLMSLILASIIFILTMKTLHDMKLQNYRLYKENALLSKKVKENMSKEKFEAETPDEKDLVQLETAPQKDVPEGMPWSVRVQVLWYSPSISPCNMHWLSHELAAQIWMKTNEMKESADISRIQHIEEKEEETISTDVIEDVEETLWKREDIIKDTLNSLEKVEMAEGYKEDLEDQVW